MNSDVLAPDAGEIAKALGVSKRAVNLRAAREAWPFKEVATRGGKRRLYPFDTLPEDVQLAVAAARASETRRQEEAKAAACPKLAKRVEAAWSAWRHAKGWRKKVAERRQDALFAVEKACRDEGVSLTAARERVAAQAQADGIKGVNLSSLIRWKNTLRGIPRPHWLAFLLPEAKEPRKRAFMHPLAWAAYSRDWQRPEQPDAESCYRRVVRLADVHRDWLPLPCLKTFERHIKRELPRGQVVLARKGKEALMEMGPKIRRHRRDLSAMDMVNADGHTFDVAVQYPDGSTGRPVILGWQDIYSGKLLSYRIGRSETADVVRLSFCDMVEKYGIPKCARLDNGRAFASKTNTGGVPTRYRYKVREEDPQGVLTRLGVAVHWVTPYNGKAKPIERAWRDIASDVSKRPEFAGAYLGNSPTTKPANYGSRAVPWDEFLRVVADGVAEYNARTGRETETAQGRSFDATFADSYRTTCITKATREQLALLLLASVAVKVNKDRAHVTLCGNRYWIEALTEHMSKVVELRFDPAAMHAGVHVFALDSTYLCFAPCEAAIGHNDQEAARDEIRRQRNWHKKNRELLAADLERNAAAPSEMPAIPEPNLPAPAATALFIPRRKPTPDAQAQEADVDNSPSESDLFFIEMARTKKRNAL